MEKPKSREEELALVALLVANMTDEERELTKLLMSKILTTLDKKKVTANPRKECPSS